MTAERRKGASRTADVSPELLADLNAGTVQTATLSECLVVDFSALLGAVAPDALAHYRAEPGQGITARMALAAEALLAARGEAALALAAHGSDTVRGWAAFAAGRLPCLSLERRLALLRPLADDGHFGVREWAWLALRPHLAADLAAAFTLLAPWTAEPSANLRRFAVEATRPRGVWCAHIAALKQDPEPGLAVLEPVKADPAMYVQDSCANWLNDAAKTRPDWVRAVLRRWEGQAAPALLKRAARSL